MTLDEILEMWQVDAKMDRSELGAEAARIPIMHHKYLRLFLHERLALKAAEKEYNVLKLETYEYYTQGPTKDSKRDPKTFPARGVIMKNDAAMYLDADSDLAKAQLKVEYLKSKVEALEYIIKAVNNRSYLVRDAIDWHKWNGGG